MKQPTAAAKAELFAATCGTTEVVPFPKSRRFQNHESSISAVG